MTKRFYTLLGFSAITFTLLSILLCSLKGHLVPVFGSVVLVYLTKPLQKKLCAQGLSNHAAAFIISLSLFSIIVFMLCYGLPLILTEFVRLIKQLPANVETTYSLLNQFLAPYDLAIDTSNLPKILSQMIAKQDFTTLQTLPKVLISTLGQFIDLVLFLTSILFIPIFFFFALQQSEHIMISILGVVPPVIRDDIADFITIVHDTISTWVVGQGSVIILLAIMYTAGFFLLEIPYAITLGVFTGLLYLIPAVGPFIMLVITSTITIASSGLDLSLIAQLIGVYTVIQTIESFVLAPYFIGNKLGINLPTCLFSILVGGGLFGGIGIILAVPTASLLKKTIELIQEKQTEDWIYD